MKNIGKTLLTVAVAVILVAASYSTYAGNPDRRGQSAASQLLINPWAASNGWGTAGLACIKGLESMYSNVAGMSFVTKTELGYTNTQYCYGTDVTINALGIAQSLGEYKGVLGVSVMMMSFGDIEITTGDQPEGGQGTFSPTLMNLGLSYAKSFSDAIKVGATVRLINEGTSNTNATGFTLDAGIQYITGGQDNFHLAVAIKNIGMPMKYSGDGLDIRGSIENGTFIQTLQNRSAGYEMPANLSLGLSYDFLIGSQSGAEKAENAADATHRITLAGTFISNAYSNDQVIFGMEYSWKEMFQIRGGFTMENGLFSDENTTTLYSGPSAGASILIPMGKSKVAIDYAYRFTNKWKGCHFIGARIAL
ncbi:MAG: PorV/PorQ family protein [Bacteroidales bacterium]|nr:PorV/PorQ family protein [Bacteroidales bacterium]